MYSNSTVATKVYKIRITDPNKMKRLSTEWAKLDRVLLSLRQPFVSGVVDSSRSVLRVLYTVSCNISHMLDSKVTYFEDTVQKQCTKFHQNRPSSVRDITKKTFWSLFLWTQCAYATEWDVHSRVRLLNAKMQRTRVTTCISLCSQRNVP